MAGIAVRRRKPYADADAQRLHQLTLRAVPFEDRLGDFLETITLQSETDAYDPRADRVTLMSLHASKGLEFPVVFIVGCEEGLLPYERKGEALDVEEERRLFYVGLTRAGRKLILTHAAEARPVRSVHGECALMLRGRHRDGAEGSAGEAVSPPGAEAGERADELVLIKRGKCRNDQLG